MTTQEQIYQELNKFADGDLEGFLRDCIEEKHENKPYNDFYFEHVGDRLLMFGFYASDGVSDPFFTVDVEEKMAKVKGLDTRLGYIGPNSLSGIPFDQKESDAYCLQFIQEINRRKFNSTMKRISRKNTLTGESI